MDQDHTYALAANQRDLWLDQLLCVDSHHLVVGGFGQIALGLDPALLQQALIQLVRETDALRLIPSARGAAPVQIWHADPKPQLEIKSFTAAQKEQAMAWIVERFSRPFPLDDTLLFQFRLARVGDAYSIFSHKYHHVICDGFSTAVLLRRWAEIYSYLSEGIAPPQHNGASYLDYLASERTYRQSAAFARDRDYWQTMFDRPVSALFPGQSGCPSPVQTLSLRFSRDRFNQIIKWSKQYQGVPYHLFLGLLVPLLMASDQEGEVVIGIPVHHRSGLLRNTPGMLVDLNPIRLTWNPEQTFEQLLTDVIQQMRKSFRHKRFPVGEIARMTGLAGGEKRLFDVVLTHDKWDLTTDFNGIPAHSSRIFSGLGSHALLVTILENHPDEDIQLLFEFNRDRVPTEERSLMVERARHLLDAVMAHPERPMGRLDFLPPAQKEQIVSGFNPAIEGAHVSSWMPVHQAFEHQAQLTPHAEALRWADHSMDYGDLNRSANQLAHHLIELGVRSNSAVGICIHRSPAMIVAVLAILKARGGYLPLDPEHPPARIKAMCETAGVALLITSEEEAALLQGLSCKCIVLKSAFPFWPEGLELEGFESDPPLSEARDTLAYVIHTSGTTGQPKGVMVGHWALACRLAWMAETVQISAADRVLQFFRLGFDPAAHEIFLPLSIGACLVLPPAGRQTPQVLATLAEAHRITILSLVPAMLDGFVKGAEACKLEALRIVTSGGEALSAALATQVQQGLNCRLLNFYGPTEATILATCWAGDPSLETGYLPLGKPLDHSRIYVLDRAGQVVPIGKSGQIHIGGSALAKGYLNHPELTEKQFVADPFSPVAGARMYRTGDRGQWRADGQLLFLGRMDRQVKLRGYRIELEEIESVLIQHPAVQLVAVQLFPLPENQGNGEVLAAYVIQDAVDSLILSEKALRHFLRKRLPDYMIPSVIQIVETLPLSDNGKVDYTQLPKPQISKAVSRQIVPPDTLLEKELLALWEGVLSQEKISVHDDFFTLGGDSLSALTLMAEMEKKYAVTLPLRALFQQPTIAAIGQIIQAQQQGSLSSASAQTDGQGLIDEVTCMVLNPILPGIKQNPPFFCIASALGDRQRLGRIAEALGPQYPFFLLQPPGCYSDEDGPPSMAQLAVRYVRCIRQFTTEQEIHIGGYSIGGSAALFVGQLLTEQGMKPGPPILLDTIYPTLIPVYYWGYRLISAMVKMTGRRFHLTRRFGDSGLQIQLRALNQSAHQPYPGLAILIQGTPMSGWSWRMFGRRQRYFPQGLVIKDVMGGHAGMTRGKYLQKLVQSVRHCLDRKG
ncbi:MAG: amino acid adenylation domain-containing protein [Magnetococcales bacterium]|nr:amino acid adenylation domain-containing protein [Magnetococcales bacterium]